MHPDKVEVITDRLKTYGFAKVGGWKLGKNIDRKMREGFDPDRLIVTRFSSSDLMIEADYACYRGERTIIGKDHPHFNRSNRLSH